MAGIEQDFNFDDNKDFNVMFDFKGLFFKILNSWYLIVLCIGIACAVAYYINVRKQNIYRLSTLISVESEQNPFFTANTSISFNWGGVNGKLGKVMTTLSTRSHNELVVDSLQFYKQYLKEGKYRLVDIYTASPFEVEIDKNQWQGLGVLIQLKHVDNKRYKILANFGGASVRCQRYADREINSFPVTQGAFEKEFNYGETVSLPFFNGKVHLREGKVPNNTETYYVRFLGFDQVVSSYQNSVVASFFKASSTILSLTQAGTNKSKIVDYLNTTATILKETELRSKNLYATNTIDFIDSTLNSVSDNLKAVNAELDDFRKTNKVFNVSEEMVNINERLRTYELQRDNEQIKLNYLESLETYLKNKSDYTKIAAPTSVGIDEGGLLNSINRIIRLATDRQNQEKTAREGSILLRRLDSQIDAEKSVAMELINNTRGSINLQLRTINGFIGRYRNQLGKLPKEQQEYLKIKRNLDINQQSYDVYLAKRSEAAIVKAANVSDIVIIDPAKDVGNGPIGPNKSLNYMMALLIGSIIPITLIFLRFILDNTIHSAEDVQRLSKVPIIGLVGKYKHPNNLVAFEKPKSAVAESFRAIRSSLQFIYKNQKDAKGSKTLLFTSSISGEGKTFCSINVATVYAMSGKKTVLVGLDLRKPKIYDDFEIKNNKGAVDYLINDGDLEHVVHNTHIPNLDLILSGPIPPNPSELLMSDRMTEFIEDLKSKYDMIVLDAPPLGLVTDALEISRHADATIFMLRLNYTKKGMLSLINSKIQRGELRNVNFLLNFYKHKRTDGYGYGYGYGYGSYGDAYHEKRNKGLFNRLKRLFKGKR